MLNHPLSVTLALASSATSMCNGKETASSSMSSFCMARNHQVVRTKASNIKFADGSW